MSFLAFKNDSFYKIILYTGSTGEEPLYQYLKQKIPELEIYTDINEVPDLKEFDDQYKDKEKLIIFDDFINLNKKQMGKINEYLTEQRYWYITASKFNSTAAGNTLDIGDNQTNGLATICCNSGRSGNINISNTSINAHNINIGNTSSNNQTFNLNSKTINIGNTSSNNQTFNLNSKNINIGNTTIVSTVNIGNTATGSIVNINGGTGQLNGIFISDTLPINCVETYCVTANHTLIYGWGAFNPGYTTYYDIPTSGTKRVYKPSSITLTALSGIKSVYSNDGRYYLLKNGLYEIKISVLFKYFTGTIAICPQILICKNDISQEDQHSVIPTIQANNYQTVSSSCISYFTTIEYLSFDLQALDISGNSITIPINQYSLSNLSISIRYLGLYPCVIILLC